ncbi:MAG: hypothetical protein WBQ08_14480 [Candidatus Sulfotelmatobacter sp.]
MRKRLKSVDKRYGRHVLISFVYAIAVTALFALICPAVLVVIVIAYARFVIYKSVAIEWGVLGMFEDPLGAVACGVVFITVFVWRVRRQTRSSQTHRDRQAGQNN